MTDVLNSLGAPRAHRCHGRHVRAPFPQIKIEVPSYGPILGVYGFSDFDALHSGKLGDEVRLYAFDVLATRRAQAARYRNYRCVLAITTSNPGACSGQGRNSSPIDV